MHSSGEESTEFIRFPQKIKNQTKPNVSASTAAAVIPALSPRPGNPGLPPRGEPPGPAHDPAPQRRRPARRPRGSRRVAGRPGVLGQGAAAAGPAGPRPSRLPPPTTPNARPGPHPHPGPRRPRCSPGSGPGRTPARPPASHRRPALAARPACAALPAALREPGDVGRAWGRLCLPFSCFFFFFSFPPFPSAGLTDQSERRWQWTRKLGCRCYCSPLGSGESLSLSSKRAKKAGLPGLHRRGSSLLQHHYRHCEDITPESRSSALRNDNFPTILEAEERGAGGKSAPAPDKVQISTSHLWKKVHTGRLHRRLGEKAGKKLGVLEKRFICTTGQNVSASSDGEKSLQDTGFPIQVLGLVVCL
ncbi:translation initiation factor IF-2-like [Lontra canadensis]|uniref:translation initiation factor IF-2-like n=1 Tax=Lontra canadensis TaxID=76717 RepID=UPI0013F35B08|nr:translation initiation factor IF-2-like [Lontra canadensis]